MEIWLHEGLFKTYVKLESHCNMSSDFTAWKVSVFGVFSGPHSDWRRTPNADTFHVVFIKEIDMIKPAEVVLLPKKPVEWVRMLHKDAVFFIYCDLQLKIFINKSKSFRKSLMNVQVFIWISLFSNINW